MVSPFRTVLVDGSKSEQLQGADVNNVTRSQKIINQLAMFYFLIYTIVYRQK